MTEIIVHKGDANWGRKSYLKIVDNKVIFDCSDDEYGPIEFDVDLLKDALIDKSKDDAKTQLINLLENQVMDLVMMSKIELGDDVIAEIKRLKEIIDEDKKTKEEMDKSKTELLNQLKEMNISSDNLDWVTEQLDQTINEELERQKDKSKK